MKTFYVPDNYRVTEHFTAQELACKGTGMMQFHDGFLEALEELRSAWGKPMTVNSCCRDPAHNIAIGGHPRSLHLTSGSPHNTNGTLAIDISIRGMDGTARGELHHLAKERGWSTGLNVQKQFLHLDLRTLIGLPQRDFFYEETK